MPVVVHVYEPPFDEFRLAPGETRVITEHAIVAHAPSAVDAALGSDIEFGVNGRVARRTDAVTTIRNQYARDILVRLYRPEPRRSVVVYPGETNDHPCDACVVCHDDVMGELFPEMSACVLPDGFFVGWVDYLDVR